MNDRTRASDDYLASLTGSAEPPMANGEVVFAEPWQGRVFGMAVRLAEEHVFEWAEFQASLIEVIGEYDTQPRSDEEYPYFELFAEALSRLLVSHELVTQVELHDRDAALAARPHGHDH